MNEQQLLYAIRDATDNGRIEWLINDTEFQAALPGLDYMAIMYCNDRYMMEIRDTAGKLIGKIEPRIMRDRSTISYIHSCAMKSTSQSEAVFDEIIKSLSKA